MSKESSVELFFDYIDTIGLALYDYDKTMYLKSINEALSYLLDDQLENEYPEKIVKLFKQEKAKITNQSFDKEMIRKAIQLALLRGFKHAKITNAQMTPDSIGIFISYLIKKLYKEKALDTVFDPLIGTSNLVATLYNHYGKPFKIVGVDDDALMCDLARNILDALAIDHQIYFQDTLTFLAEQVDLIITDFPPQDKTHQSMYLPYHAIVHHLDHLKSEHYFIALIENDFFEQKQQALFKELITPKAHLFGLIKLDEGLFKTHAKSLLILKKKTHETDTLKDFLIVDLPSFTDLENFNKALSNMEEWFKKKEVDVQ
ncbi:MAG: class I SAM-dependent methyltransferase [Candidatus Izemoplasmataceae bacterium]